MINKSKIEEFFDEINKENDKSVMALSKDLMLIVDKYPEINSLNLLFAFLIPIQQMLKNNIIILENGVKEIISNETEINDISVTYRQALNKAYIKCQELENPLLAMIYNYNKEMAALKAKIEE